MDIRCAICGEPWDSYGIGHGDMYAWQARLFRAGAGCPACEGQAPEGADPERALEDHCRSVIFGGTDDPHAFETVNTLGLEHQPPAWKRPADEVAVECAGCDTRIMIDADDGRRYWAGADARHGYARDEPDPEDFATVDGERYCPECVTACAECGTITLREHSYPDPRSAGDYFSDDRLCGDDCLSTAENEAEEQAWDDWGAREFRRAIVAQERPLGEDDSWGDAVEEALDALSDSDLWEIFHAAGEQAGEAWYHTNEGPSCDWAGLAKHVDARADEATGEIRFWVPVGWPAVETAFPQP